MQEVCYDKKNDEYIVDDATVKPGKPSYVVLLQGHTGEDYDVAPYCYVEITPGLAAEWLHRIDTLKTIPGAEHLGSAGFHDCPANWFAYVDPCTNAEDPLEEALRTAFDQDVVLLDQKQAQAIKLWARESDPIFRPDGQSIELASSVSPERKKHDGVYFNCYEKHCSVLISTAMIYRDALEQMAGDLYTTAKPKKTRKPRK